MIWKKEDKLRPTQPFLVNEMPDFTQKIYIKNGISHFYGYTSSPGSTIKLVPDGCIDILFTYKKDRMDAYVCGTVLEYTERDSLEGEVFGVRFMPGHSPAGINLKPGELVNIKHNIDDQKIYGPLLKSMSGQDCMKNRINTFLNEYAKIGREDSAKEGQEELFLAVKNYIYDYDGKMEISEIAELTGYSPRYVCKVFSDEMGFAPKRFCKIIQFQRTLEFLNNQTDDNMTDAAVALGFYDQPQFIRDFKRFAGMTPKHYLKYIHN